MIITPDYLGKCSVLSISHQAEEISRLYFLLPCGFIQCLFKGTLALQNNHSRRNNFYQEWIFLFALALAELKALFTRGRLRVKVAQYFIQGVVILCAPDTVTLDKNEIDRSVDQSLGQLSGGDFFPEDYFQHSMC